MIYVGMPLTASEKTDILKHVPTRCGKMFPFGENILTTTRFFVIFITPLLDMYRTPCDVGKQSYQHTLANKGQPSPLSSVTCETNYTKLTWRVVQFLSPRPTPWKRGSWLWRCWL